MVVTPFNILGMLFMDFLVIWCHGQNLKFLETILIQSKRVLQNSLVIHELNDIASNIYVSYAAPFGILLSLV